MICFGSKQRCISLRLKPNWRMRNLHQIDLGQGLQHRATWRFALAVLFFLRLPKCQQHQLLDMEIIFQIDRVTKMRCRQFDSSRRADLILHFDVLKPRHHAGISAHHEHEPTD